jgi:hypothetical protein
VASESIAFAMTGDEYVREVRAGEMLFFSIDGSERYPPGSTERAELFQNRWQQDGAVHLRACLLRQARKHGVSVTAFTGL